MARFGDEDTQDVYDGTSSTAVRKTITTTALSVARRKLLQVVSATRLDDLRFPPGNRLESLKGGAYAGYHSIRVNDQFRICFHWTDAGAADIVIVDYH
jgi:toxin HigB-1